MVKQHDTFLLKTLQDPPVHTQNQVFIILVPKTLHDLLIYPTSPLDFCSSHLDFLSVSDSPSFLPT